MIPGKKADLISIPKCTGGQMTVVGNTICGQEFMRTVMILTVTLTKVITAPSTPWRAFAKIMTTTIKVILPFGMEHVWDCQHRHCFEVYADYV
mmetsp:Transcript_21540/g.31298  ORF Transcript_21540/g.31298 Transcript_21540/m.31298 type:complete len:93 (-) Transcript_21540:150-428(-)